MANRIQIDIVADAGTAKAAFRDLQEGSLGFRRSLKGVRREFSGMTPELTAGFRQIETASRDAFTQAQEESRLRLDTLTNEITLECQREQEYLSFLQKAQETTATSLQIQSFLWSQFTDATGGFVKGLESQFAKLHEGMALVGIRTFTEINNGIFDLIKGTNSMKDVWQEAMDAMLKAVIKFATSEAIKLLIKVLSAMGTGGAGPGTAPFASGGGGGIPFLDKLLDPVTKFVKKIPIIGGFFQQGTPFVPQDMLAFLHRGEAIVPRELNPFAGDLREPMHSFGAPRNFGLEGRMDRLMGLLERQSRPFQVRFERGAFHGAQIRSDRDIDRLALEIEKRLRRRERLQLVPRVG